MLNCVCFHNDVEGCGLIWNFKGPACIWKNNKKDTSSCPCTILIFLVSHLCIFSKLKSPYPSLSLVPLWARYAVVSVQHFFLFISIVFITKSFSSFFLTVFYLLRTSIPNYFFLHFHWTIICVPYKVVFICF